MRAPRIGVEIIDGPLDGCAPAPTGPQVGGEVVFIGRTRAETHPEHGALLALDYDLHETLTRRVLEDIAARTARTVDAQSIHIRHARGMVPVGGASVQVSVCCKHRREAFDACSTIMDELKAAAPIFKHERWAHGTTWAPGQPPPGAG